MSLGPRLKRALVAPAAALALLPASAFAQGAGDDQYADPFGSETEERAQPTATPRAPAATPAPAPAQPVPDAAQPVPDAAPPTGRPAPVATASAGGPTLPYTGLDGWLVAGTGGLLLGAGLTLRARLRDPD